jgi:hypothetical protein
MSKSEWKKLIPENRWEKEKMFNNAMIYDRDHFVRSVDSKDEAIKIVETIILILERSDVDIKTALVVLYEMADHKLGKNQGVEWFKEVIVELLED